MSFEQLIKCVAADVAAMLQRVVRLLSDNVTFRQRLLHHSNRLWYSLRTPGPYNDRGIDVFEEDWDNLLILDACRYDYFEKRADLPGTLESRTSKASSTREWVWANFTDKQLHDVVYVSANPNFRKVAADIDAEVHAYVDVWEDETTTDSGANIVPPKTVTRYAREAAVKYPQKRLLVHYVQPHYPFLGSTGREQFDPSMTLREVSRHVGDNAPVLRTAYEENLDLVLADVAELILELQGKTVVSADHGELLGERLSPIPFRAYGHPIGIYVDELTNVPWHVYTNGDRKKIVVEPPIDRERPDPERVEEQLRNLGYVT